MTGQTSREVLTIGVFLSIAFLLFTFLGDAPPQQPLPAPVPIVQPQNVPEPGPLPQNLPVMPLKVGRDGQLNFGYEPNPEATKRFLRTLPKPTFPEAAPELIRKSSANEPVLLYRAVYEAFAHFNPGETWQCSTQGIGDCVSHGWGQSIDELLAVMWKLGETAEWRSAATEAIYGGSRVEARGVSHGGWADGSYGGAAAKWVRDWGVVFRQPYKELGIDLSTYSSSVAKNWGNYGCGGQYDNGRLDAIAKQHPVRNVALVSSFEEAAAAISSGYPVPVCSGQGFSSRRDEQGFCRPSGSWSHCMCFIGVRHDRPGLLCLNSWGPHWVSGPKWPEDQPDGSFWVDRATADRMLRGQDSFAVSGYDGFPYRDLTHGDWVQTKPGTVRAIAIRNALRRSTRLTDKLVFLRQSETEFALAP